jgi:hypothetical protein
VVHGKLEEPAGLAILVAQLCVRRAIARAQPAATDIFHQPAMSITHRKLR